MAQEPTYDTAGSAKMIKEKNLLDCAAIGESSYLTVHPMPRENRKRSYFHH